MFASMTEDLPEDLPEETPEPRRFTVRQQRFIDAFCISGVCTQAARDAGYSIETAYSIGSRLLKNVEIKAAIDERLAAYSISAALTTKLNAEIAITRLNEFFTIRPVQGHEMEEHYLSVLADRVEQEIVFIREFAATQGLPLMTALGPSKMGERLEDAQKRLLELQLEIQQYGPDATKLVPGKPVIHYRADLDIVKLAEAKEGGRLKSYSVGKEGIKVEMYAADAAIDRAARMHGLYEKDNHQAAGTDVELTIGGKRKKEAQD
jgi:phage terminase small subunit